MTLPFMAAVHCHLLQLLFRLDAFCDHGLVEAGAETRNRADDRLSVAFFAKAGNERLVDLDLLERKLAKIVERRIARTEVVERDADTEILELFHDGQRSVAVLEQQALGDFQLQPLRGKSRLRQCRNYLQGEAAVAELYWRKIDGGTMPRLGCRQRINASQVVTRPLRRSTSG